VIIANLSPGGAMIKASLVPSPGSDVQLVGEGRSAKAVVVWRSRNRCGIRFLEEIQVGAWVLPLRTDRQRDVDQSLGALNARESLFDPIATSASALNPATAEQRLDELMTVLRLLDDLEADLSSSAETVRMHGGRMPLFETAMNMLRQPELHHCPRHQFIDGLGEVFELVRELEDELTSCTDTLVRHSYKLQHLDFAMQMLTEISASALAGDADPSADTTRMQRLRSACESALSLHLNR
jgi:hypothetical protein